MSPLPMSTNPNGYMFQLVKSFYIIHIDDIHGSAAKCLLSIIHFASKLHMTLNRIPIMIFHSNDYNVNLL